MASKNAATSAQDVDGRKAAIRIAVGPLSGGPSIQPTPTPTIPARLTPSRLRETGASKRRLGAVDPASQLCFVA